MICVLMSTFNGERYLREQIDSILSQKETDVTLIVRDDGSTDSTLDILEEYSTVGKLSYYSDGESLGPQHSFMRMLNQAPKADYYAFSDQDDVWLEDKLSTAIHWLKTDLLNPLGLYFCQTKLVDKDLNELHQITIRPYCTFGESLIYKFIGGCTIVITQQLRNVLCDHTPQYLPMHDIWVYAVAQALDAKIHFDPVPHILYRQHGGNAIGQGHSFWYNIRLRWRRFTKRRNERWAQAYELLSTYYDDIPDKQLQLLQLFVKGKHSFLQRIRIVRNHELRCADKLTQYLFWVHVLFNTY